MLTRVRKGWELSENHVTPESTFMNRRQILKTGGQLGLGIAATSMLGGMAHADTSDLYPAPRASMFEAGAGRELATEQTITNYNNFYEFGTSKYIQRAAQRLKTDPWPIEMAACVATRKPLTLRTLPDACQWRSGFIVSAVLKHGAWSFLGVALPFAT